MWVGKTTNENGTFNVMRCVCFQLQAKDAALQGSYDYVKRETTVVPPLPAARANRAETLQYRQTERTR